MTWALACSTKATRVWSVCAPCVLPFPVAPCCSDIPFFVASFLSGH